MAITKNSQIDLNGNEMILDADGDTTITADTDDQIDFKTAGTDRVTIGASGNLFVGSSTSNGISGDTTGLQVAGAGFAGMISATRHDNNAYGSNLMLGKSRNTTVGSNTIIQNGDAVGAIGFFADDGTNLDSQVAYITASVDGAPGENDTPGRLTFSTTADGSAAVTERMRIDSSGNVGIGATSVSNKLHLEVSGNNGIYADADNPLMLKNASTTDGATVGQYFGCGNGVGAILTAQFPNADTNREANFIISTANSSNSLAEKVRVISGIGVGIGTTDVTSNAGFDNTLVLGGSQYSAMIIKSTTGNQECVASNLASGGFRFDVAGATSGGNNKIKFQTTQNNSNYNTYLRMCISATGNIGTTDGGTNIYNASDARLKQNINSLSDSLNIINNLNPVSFNWADNFSEAEKDKTLYGFIAQEVQDVFPDAIEDFSAGDDIELNGETIENPLAVREKFIIPVLVKAMQEQQEQIEALQSEINTLKGE